jgi:hypothetical protein
MFMRLFDRFSHLPALITQYATTQDPQGEDLSRQTIQIGAVRYRNCVTVTIDERGLFLCIDTVFKKYPRICIPWKAFKTTQPSRIYARPARQCSIGEPAVGTLRIPESLFRKMGPYLTHYPVEAPG